MEIPIFSNIHNFGNFMHNFKQYFTHPQYRNITHYILGLILCEGKRTITHLTEAHSRHYSYNRLHHFLSESPWQHDEVNQQRITYLIQTIDSCVSHKEQAVGFLIADDTTNPKRGSTMPGFGKYYSTVAERPIPGQCIITTVYQYQSFDFPLSASLYKQKHSCQTNHKKKNDLLIEQLRSLVLPRHIRTLALLDSFYFNQHVISVCRQKSIDAIGRLKINRRVSSSYKDLYGARLDRWVDTLRFHPRTFFTKITVPDSHGTKRQLWMYHKNVTIKNLGPVQLVMLSSKLRGKNVEPVFLATTAFDLSPQQIVEYYFKRWAIETFFWTIKERLGFNHYQVRSEQATIRHWLLVFFAYSYLSLMRFKTYRSYTLGQIRCIQQKENLRTFIVYLYENVKYKRKNANTIYYDLAA